MSDVVQIAVAAGVQGVVGLLFYFAVNRQVEKVDNLEKKVDDLESHRIAKIESDIRDADKHNEEMFRASAAARKGIYEELTWVKTHFVHAKTCTDAHKTLQEAINRFLAATTDLARHDERLAALTKQIHEMREQLIGLKQDFDRTMGGETK